MAPVYITFNQNVVTSNVVGNLDVYSQAIFVDSSNPYPSIYTMSNGQSRLFDEQFGAVHLQGGRNYYDAAAAVTFPARAAITITSAANGFIFTNAATGQTASFTAAGAWQVGWQVGTRPAPAVEAAAPKAPAGGVDEVDDDQKGDGKGYEGEAKPKY